MQGSDILQRARNKKARDQRIAGARSVVDGLAPDEREELLIGYLAEMEIGVENSGDNPGASIDPESPSATANANSAPQFIKPLGYTVKQAITDAMHDGRRRAAADIAKATKELHPWVNVNSVPAALARLVTDGVLLKRGKTSHGHPKYVIATTPTNGTE